jgi:hypothetical protein
MKPKKSEAKISFENHGITITIERDMSDLTIFEWLEMVETGLMGISFGRDQVLEAMVEYAQDKLDNE